MPVLDTGRKQLSSVIGAGSGYQNKGIQKSYATIGLIDAAEATTAPMGIPVIHVDSVADPAADAYWAVYTNQSLGSEDSDLPDGSKVAVVIGKDWAGDNREDITFSATEATDVVVVYRDSVVKMDGITFSGNAATQTAFRLALEKQGVVVIDSEADAQSAYES